MSRWTNDNDKPVHMKNIPAKTIMKALQDLINRSERDVEFRKQLLANPKNTIERELQLDLPDDHEILIHEKSKSITHLILPPESSITKEEREAAKTGKVSLEYLKKTMYDPAPQLSEKTNHPPIKARSSNSLKELINVRIEQGLDFLESTISENGAWHCIRYHGGMENPPRHYERPPFVSAYCTLALENCELPKAKSICAAAKQYILATMEFPGLWRYYRHLPPDLDSTTLCSMILSDHPWIALGQNLSKILSYRNDEGLYNTWVLDSDEPDVVSPFRIEADPVVNANIISLLGDCSETRPIQNWLESLLQDRKLEDSSKWYTDSSAICYGIGRAVNRTKPLLDHLGKPLAENVISNQDQSDGFGNILQTAQAITALHNSGQMDMIDPLHYTKNILNSQHEDGSWPELIAFGDKKAKWGNFGQFVHASESMTTAFCIEALINLGNSL